MTDYELIAAIIFISFLAIFLHFKRKNLDTKPVIQNVLYFSMFRTKLGIKPMESWANKWNRFFKILGYIGIVVGFLGMGLIAFELVRNLVVSFTHPDAAPGV